jgi:DNA invertase Pin-like site-specific DNA recombinase
MATRAVIYARVSTLVGQSPQMQLDVLREYAARRGLAVVAEFVDQGVSGARDQRPELDRLMGGARQRAFDLVLVYRFDRFARSVRHLVTALDEFQALGVEFVSYSESLDTSTPMGRAMFSIVAALAELERDIIVERSVEGQRRARARGKHIGRPRRQVDAARILRLRAKGKSLRAIARTMGASRTVVTRVVRERGAA